MKLTAEQKALRLRIIEISHENHFSHLGSCLSIVDIICAVYKIKHKNEKFVLSCGHAAVALYAVLEKYGLLNTFNTRGLSIHPDRNPSNNIDLSTGSLGQGLPIALGMALADRDRSVYCAVSDGECAEGSIWESLRLGLERKAGNLKIIINANGWGAYTSISSPLLLKRIEGFGYKVKVADGHDVNKLSQLLKARSSDRPNIIFAKTTVQQLPFLKGQDAHYYVMNDNDYKLALKALK